MVYSRIFDADYIDYLVGTLPTGWYVIRIRPGNPGPAETAFREPVMAAVLLYRYLDSAPLGAMQKLLDSEACLLGPYTCRDAARRARHGDDAPRRKLIRTPEGQLRWTQHN